MVTWLRALPGIEGMELPLRIDAGVAAGVLLSALDGRREDVAGLTCVPVILPTPAERGGPVGLAVPTTLRALSG